MDFRYLVGMDWKEAKEILESLKVQWRLGAVDDEMFMLTCDYVPSRVTIHLNNMKVTGVELG